MKVIEKHVYKFSKNNTPIETAEPEEILIFKSMDCFSNKIVTEKDLADDVLECGYDSANPAAGPVYINGAEPGDVLVVDILDIKVADKGVIATMAEVGPLYEDSELRSKFINVKDGIADFNGFKFPIDPMIGVIGTAPDGDDVICGSPGDHGGNMDSKVITKGAKVYFPVKVPGALLQMGDVHATMGDGEVCGTGIEIPAEITVKISLIKNFELNMPVTETADRWYVNAVEELYPDALKKASKELQRLLMAVTGWDKTDIFLYMSALCDVEINQACCDTEVVLRYSAPKMPGYKPLIG